MAEDLEKKEHARKALKVYTTVQFPQGGYIGGGWIDDPAFSDADMGIVVIGPDGKQVLGFEMNIETVLILSQVIVTTVRMYLTHKAGNLILPFRKSGPKS